MSDFIDALRRAPRLTTADLAFLSIHDAQAAEIARLKAENEAAAAEIGRLTDERDSAESAERAKDRVIADLQTNLAAMRAALHEAVLQVIREAMPRKEGEGRRR